MNAKAIEKKIKSAVKHGAIQNVINYIFYASEYLNWSANKYLYGFPSIKRNFANRWEYIHNFETITKPEDVDIASILAPKQKRVKKEQVRVYASIYLIRNLLYEK